MQKVTLICVGKLKEKFYAQATAEYAKRLSRFVSWRSWSCRNPGFPILPLLPRFLRP